MSTLRAGATLAWYGSIGELLIAGFAAACGVWVLGLQLGQVAVVATLAWSACGLVSALGFVRLSGPEPGGPDTLASREDVHLFARVLCHVLGSVAALCALGLLAQPVFDVESLLVVMGVVHVAHAMLVSALALAAARYGRDLSERVPDEACARWFALSLTHGTVVVLATALPAIWLALEHGPEATWLVLISGPWVWRLCVAWKLRTLLLGTLTD
ncbi:MAG: hypothetical protein AAGG07_06845 [Planctomycetota bacterium]